MISNAISAVEEPFLGIVADSGDVIFSRHRRDNRESDDKSAFIAGGRDRASYDMEHHLVKLIVFKDKVVVFPKENKKTWCEVPYTEELDWDIAQI